MSVMGIMAEYKQMIQGVMYPEGVNTRKANMVDSAKSVALASLPAAILLSVFVLCLASIGSYGNFQIQGLAIAYALLLLILCPLFALFNWVALAFVSWAIGKLFSGKGDYTKFAAVYGIPFAGLVLLSTFLLIPLLGLILGIGLWFWNLTILFRIYRKVMKLSADKALLAVVVYFLFWLLFLFATAFLAFVFTLSQWG